MNDSPQLEILTTVDAVIDALGGTGAAARLVNAAIASASNWRAAGRLPARTYLKFQAALAAIGRTAPASLWGIEPADISRGD